MVCGVGLAGLAGLTGLAACDEPGGRGSFGDVLTDIADVTVPDGDELDTSAADTSMPDTTPAETVAGPPPVTSPSCVDGQWDEVVPDDGAPIGDLVAGYAAADYLAFTDAVLAKRYPFGGFLVREANATGAGGLGNCISAFTSNRQTARGLISELSTVVHECGHLHDLD